MDCLIVDSSVNKFIFILIDSREVHIVADQGSVTFSRKPLSGYTLYFIIRKRAGIESVKYLVERNFWETVVAINKPFYKVTLLSDYSADSK